MSKPSRSEGGEDRSFKDELVELIPFLRAFARTLCGDPATADDLAQETLLKAWKSRRQFERGTNLKAWTYMILRNHFYSEKRRAWRQAAWDEEKAERTLTAASDQAAVLELDELRRALAELPAEQREALMLVGAAGFAYDEAAQICNCAVGTIKSRVNRARKALEAIHDAGAFAKSSDDKVAAEGAMEAILEEANQIANSGGA